MVPPNSNAGLGARLRKYLTHFRKFLALKWSDKLLLFEAVFYLTATKAALLLLPFWKVSEHLGQHYVAGVGAPPEGPTPPGAARVCWAVENMARRTPWKNACLPRAIAGKFMLKRRGISSQLYIGRAHDFTGTMVPHAWLRVGNENLVGAAWYKTHLFVVLSVFADPPDKASGV